jgi:phage terminase large subunit
MKLNLKQTKAIDFLEDHKTNELLFGGGAGGGKSILGCYWQIKNRFKYPRTRGLIGRAKLKTLKETTYVSFLKVCQMQGLRAGVHFNVNSQSNIITFQNKSEILMKDLFYYPSDPNFDELGSLEITDAFIDECNQLNGKAWNIVRSRLRHDIELNGLIPKMLGTCNPSKGFIYDRFYKPSRDGILGNDKQFIKSLVTDNKDYIDKYYIENLNQLDEISKQRLLHGNWEYDDDPAILMQYDNIVDLFCNEHVLTGKKFITCDVARMGKDKTIIRVWEGMRSIKKVIIDKSKLTEVAQVIKKLQTDYSVTNSNTICDED